MFGVTSVPEPLSNCVPSLTVTLITVGGRKVDWLLLEEEAMLKTISIFVHVYVFTTRLQGLRTLPRPARDSIGLDKYMY